MPNIGELSNGIMPSRITDFGSDSTSNPYVNPSSSQYLGAAQLAAAGIQTTVQNGITYITSVPPEPTYDPHPTPLTNPDLFSTSIIPIGENIPTTTPMQSSTIPSAQSIPINKTKFVIIGLIVGGIVLGSVLYLRKKRKI